MISKTPAVDDRRPLKVRSARWAKWVARGLASRGVTPNQISVASIVFAGAAAGCMLAGGWLLIGAALCIQARLLCNLFDGMVAVEHDRATPLGALYNEFPDRVADSVLFVAAGSVAGIFWLGWATALAAALTAYVRVFGAACGQVNDFRGPMAKQQRMAVLTAICVATPCLPSLPSLFLAGLIFIAVLSAVTCVTRTVHLCRLLMNVPTQPL